MVQAINELCSTCGHSRFYHEKGVHDCLVEGLNDDPSGHTFTGTKVALWSFFIPTTIPVPILYIPVEGDVLDNGGFGSDGTWTGTETYVDGHNGDTNGAMDLSGVDFVTLTNEAKYDIKLNDPFTIGCPSVLFS